MSFSKLVLGLSVSLMTTGAFAKTGPGEIGSSRIVDDGSSTIRCTGINAAGVQIGADFELDPTDRIQELTTFENEAVDIVDLGSLGAPSHFLKKGSKGEVQVFGFKSFNDGLEEVMSITFVTGKPELSVLKLGYGSNNLAVKKILCREAL